MDWKALVMGLAFATMWSSAFTSGKIIVAHAPPLAALSLRFLLAGIAGVAVARVMGQSWRLSREAWVLTLVFGICQNALYLGLNFVAFQSVPAGLAAIIASTMPLLVALFGWLALGQKLPPLGIAGLVAGFAGVALIMGGRISGGVDLYGVALCVAGVVALAVATLSVRGASRGGDLLMVVGLQMLVGAAILVVVSYAVEDWVVDWTTSLVVAFLYTTFVPGLAATILWFVLVNRIGPIRAATFHFLNPFLGVTIAALLLGEAFGALDLAGVVVIAAGILAVQIARARVQA